MMTRMHFIFGHLRVAPKWWVALFMGCWLGLALSQTEVRHAEVERELKQGRFDQVRALSERALTERPRDPQMRFWHAVALDKLGQTELALAEYQALAQDRPELPEPHNNLGVLLMRLDRIDEAQAAFEMALRMDAGYAEAMENLGDVLQWQARRWYEKSLQANPARPALKQKIQQLPAPPAKP